MPDLKLPPQVISLVHHIELNKAGWLERALGRFIIGTLWLAGGPLTTTQIAANLTSLFSINLSEATLRQCLEPLLKAGTLLALPTGQLKISEQHVKAFTAELQSAEAIEAAVKRRFSDALGSCCPSAAAEPTWNQLTNDFLFPFVREMGARTYAFLSGASADVQRTHSFSQFVERQEPSIRSELQRAVIEFLDPTDPNVRAYIFRHLNAFFLLEATSLGADAISGLSQTRPSFTVFADTNLIFSILALHDSPSNDAAAALVELLKTLPGSVTLKLYISPLTFDEARRTLEWYRDSLRNLRLTPNVAEAIKRGQLSSIAMKFVQECVRTQRSLNADDYFRPYVNNLLDTLRAKAIELYNESMESTRRSQDVIDDLTSQLEYEYRRFGEDAKTYEKMLHDVTLWHFARKKRPARVESPLNAGFWISTVDFRLLGFDAFKRRAHAIDVPVCVHPAVLVNMLQLWIPRSVQFEQTIVASLKYPILFYEYDPTAERATLRILEALGRFEGVGDLPKETVESILVDEALRLKLDVEADADKRVVLVRDALLREAAELKEKLNVAEAEIGRLTRLTRDQALEIETINAETITKAHGVENAERALREEEKRRSALEKRVGKLEAELLASSEQLELRRKRTKFVVQFVVPTLVMSCALGILGGVVLGQVAKLGPVSRHGYWLLGIGFLSTLLLGWVALVDRKGATDPAITSWPIFERFHGLKVRVFGMLATIILGAAGNAFWELVRPR